MSELWIALLASSSGFCYSLRVSEHGLELGRVDWFGADLDSRRRELPDVQLVRALDLSRPQGCLG